MSKIEPVYFGLGLTRIVGLGWDGVVWVRLVELSGREKKGNKHLKKGGQVESRGGYHKKGMAGTCLRTKVSTLALVCTRRTHIYLLYFVKGFHSLFLRHPPFKPVCLLCDIKLAY